MRYILFSVVLVNLLFAHLVNEYRNKVGLNSLKDNQYLTKAAKLHAYFMYKNHVIGHYEKEGYPYFVGVTPADRAIKVGYPSKMVLENISNGQSNFSESIEQLFGAIYHRLGFLDFNIDEIGYSKVDKFYVYDMGNSVISKACKYPSNARNGYIKMCKNPNTIIPQSIYNKIQNQNPSVLMWPYDGMSNTPVAFYSETPDPMPEYEVCGYPISISFNPSYYKNIELIKFNLQGVKTKLITSKNDVNHLLKDNQFVIFPLERLEPNKKYIVHAVFRVDGEIKHFNWSFDTKKVSNVLEVTNNNQTFYIKPNKKYIVYFKPQNKNDIIKNFKTKYSSTIHFKKIGFKDANNIYLEVEGYGDITIFNDTKKVNLKVK